MSNELHKQDDFKEVERLFDIISQLPRQERFDYLKLHASSTAIIEEVSSLLNAYDDLGGFLTEPLQIDEVVNIVCPDLTGRRIGVWKVDHLIGQGGMGRVYLAHRADGEYQQSVAFKVVEYQRFDNEAFLKERQILADLDHPNIVSLFDAGTLEEGFPYLVMEYVDGLPLDQYILQNKEISTTQLIILFIRLCKIVQSAHGHGIIHCDLKPSNILVTNEGVLKLLDFGIAQSLISLESDKKNKTKKLFSLTPEYSSENRHQQKFPKIQDDIFSLGIIFSQLLTRIPPYTKKISQYAQPDIQRIAKNITDIELKQIFLSSVNSGKHYNYNHLQELIDDLGCYLDNLPTKAMGDSFYYKTKKNLQRNWIVWGAASLVSIFLVVAGISTWKTQKSEQKIQLIREMSSGLINYVNDSLEKIPQTTHARKLLIGSAVRQLESFSQQMPDDIEMKILLADNYKKLGVVTGSPFVLSLGDTKSSKDLYDKALAVYKEILPLADDPLVIHKKINDTKREIGKLYAFQNDKKKVQAILIEMRNDMEKAYKDSPLSKQHPLAVTYIAEAHVEMHWNHLDYSQSLLDKAKKILQALDKKEQTHRYWIETRFVEEESANILLLKNKYDAAEVIYQNLLRTEPKIGHWRIDRANARINMAMACINLKRHKQELALEYFSQAFHLYKNLSERYPAVNSLKKALQKYSKFNQLIINSTDSRKLFKQLQCDRPQSFMMPLTDG